MTSRESELEKEVADLKRRVKALEKAYHDVANALSQHQRRRLTARGMPEPRYKPLARTFALLEKQARAGPWNSSQMGMDEGRFNSLVVESDNLSGFLHSVLQELLGDRMARVNLGRTSGRGEAMDFETRDKLYRLVAKYVTARPQKPPVNFKTLNNAVSHILSNNKRTRSGDSSDDSSDDGRAERRKDAGSTPKKGMRNEELDDSDDSYDDGAGPSGIRVENTTPRSRREDDASSSSDE